MGVVPTRIETKIPRTIIRGGPGLKKKILADKPARESSTKASSNLNQKSAATEESAGIWKVRFSNKGKLISPNLAGSKLFQALCDKIIEKDFRYCPSVSRRKY